MLWLEGMMGLRTGRKKDKGSNAQDAEVPTECAKQEIPPATDERLAPETVKPADKDDATMSSDTNAPSIGGADKQAAALRPDNETTSVAIEPSCDGQDLHVPTADITDFTTQDDSLLFIWDDSETDEEPTNVSVMADPENAGQLQVWMGDQVMAQISGREPLSTLDIVIIPFSSAQELALVQN